MSAFCDVILAELHRLEAQTSEKAKSDFISTMSHELRSPLRMRSSSLHHDFANFMGLQMVSHKSDCETRSLPYT